MDLMQFLNILRARLKLMLLVLTVTVATASVVSFALPKKYTAKTDLIVDATTVDPVSGMALPVQMMSSFMATQVDIINSHAVALKVVEALKLDADPTTKALFQADADRKGNLRDWLADGLRKNINVNPSRESSVLAVTFTSNDPETAASVANAFAQAYINTTLQLTVEPAKNTSRWFDEQLQIARANFANAQQTMARYQSKKGIVSTDDKLDIEIARLNELSTQMVASQGQLMADQSRIDANKPEDLPEVINNAMIQSIKTDIGKQEGIVNEMSAKLGDNNPNYIRAKEELKLLKARLEREIKTVVDSVRSSAAAAKQRDEAMRAAVEQQKARILALKGQNNSIAVLSSELQNAQKAYDFAMQRFSQANMQSQLGQTNIVVLNTAQPEYTPSKPKIFLNIGLSILLGAILAVGLALLVEMWDRIVRSETDIKKELGIPVLGVLKKPKNSRRQRMFSWA